MCELWKLPPNINTPGTVQHMENKIQKKMYMDFFFFF